MTADEIKALVEAEVKRQLSGQVRVVPKTFSEPLKPATHRAIKSNQPGKS